MPPGYWISPTYCASLQHLLQNSLSIRTSELSWPDPKIIRCKTSWEQPSRHLVWLYTDSGNVSVTTLTPNVTNHIYITNILRSNHTCRLIFYAIYIYRQTSHKYWHKYVCHLLQEDIQTKLKHPLANLTVYSYFQPAQYNTLYLQNDIPVHPVSSVTHNSG